MYLCALNPYKRDRLASEVDLRRAASQLQEHLDAEKVTPKVTPADFNAEKIKDN